MFFEDPAAAFSNIARAVRPRGRIGFVCWRSLDENELDHLPLRAASAHLPAKLVHQTADAGWFSFCDSNIIRSVLGDAGWGDIQIDARDELVGSGDLQSMVAVCSRVGALGAILREHPHLRQNAEPALIEALRPLDGAGGPHLRAATWVVTARLAE